MNDADELQTRPAPDPFEEALRVELRWEAPPELTARLMGLIPGAPGLVPLHAQQRPWYTTLVLALTAIVVGLSLAVAWQLYGLIGAQLGLTELWQQLQLYPNLAMVWLYDTLPFTRYVMAVLIGIQEQLHWLLVAAVLWLALDGWSPEFALRRQPSS